jgi:hypothetical protein
MSMGPDPGAGGAPSEEELRQAYEAELRRLRVEHVLIEHVVAMINVGMLRTGLGPDTEDERDPAQVRLAIESIRALMPVLEQAVPQQVGQIRAALSQLQMAFVKIGGGGAPAQPGEAAGGGEAPGGGGAPGGGAAGSGGGAPGGGAAGGGTPGSGGATGGPGQPGGGPGQGGGGPGPAQRSGRLWIPGQ